MRRSGSMLLGMGLAVAVLIGSTSPRADERPPESTGFKWSGEEFFYSLRVNDAEAMRASIKAGRVRQSEGRSYVPIALNVRSVGFFHDMYPVDDRANTFLNPGTFRPYRSEKYFHEAGEKRAYLVDYAHGDFHARVEKREPNKVHKFKEAIPSATHDMITWLYELRTRDVELGKTFKFYIYDGWKISWVHMKVVAEEDLYTPAGWFRSWKIKFVRKIVDSETNEKNGERVPPEVEVEIDHEHDGYFWLSHDENLLPLRVTIGTSFGYGEAILVKYNRHHE